MAETMGRLSIVHTRGSPNKEFNDDVEYVLKLLHNHMKIYPNCDIPSDTWRKSVNACIDAFNGIPDILKNKFFINTTPVNTKPPDFNTPQSVKCNLEDS